MNGLAPRCRLIFSKICRLAYWWECSSHNKVRELGSKRCKSVWSISVTIVNMYKHGQLSHVSCVLFAQYARTSNKLLKLNFVIQWYHCFQISDYQTILIFDILGKIKAWPPVLIQIRQRDQPAIIFIQNEWLCISSIKVLL